MNRVWVYQADRFLTASEVSSLTRDLEGFVRSWTAHGSALAGQVKVVDNLFVILEVDERQAGVTGCSIDKSVHFLQSLGQKYNIDFFNRLKVSYRNSKGEVSLVNRNEFEELIRKGEVEGETIVFNNLIQNSEELTSNWQIAFKDSWHSKVF